MIGLYGSGTGSPLFYRGRWRLPKRNQHLFDTRGYSLMLEACSFLLIATRISPEPAPHGTQEACDDTIKLYWKIGWSILSTAVFWTASPLPGASGQTPTPAQLG